MVRLLLSLHTAASSSSSKPQQAGGAAESTNKVSDAKDQGLQCRSYGSCQLQHLQHLQQQPLLVFAAAAAFCAAPLHEALAMLLQQLQQGKQQQQRQGKIETDAAAVAEHCPAEGTIRESQSLK